MVLGDEEPSVSSKELKVIADAWIAFHRRTDPGSGDLRRPLTDLPHGVDWAQQKLIDLVRDDPTTAVRVIELIIEATSDEWVLTNLGAGPIEDLFHAGDAHIINKLEQLAQVYPSSLVAFRNVWQHASLSDSASAVLKRIVNGR